MYRIVVNRRSERDSFKDHVSVYAHHLTKEQVEGAMATLVAQYILFEKKRYRWDTVAEWLCGEAKAPRQARLCYTGRSTVVSEQSIKETITITIEAEVDEIDWRSGFDAICLAHHKQEAQA